MAYGLYNPSINYNKPKFWLAKPNKKIISRLKEIDDMAKLSVDFGKINQLSFTIPHSKEKNNESIINPNLELINAKYLLKMEFMDNTEWFVIEQFSKEMQDADSIPVTAYSLQYELNYKKIYEIEVTSFTPQQIFENVLLHTGWTVGDIDHLLASKARSFNFSNTSVLDCLYQIAESFNGILQFDTVNQTISLYHEDTISQFNGLVLNDKNYLNTLSDQKNASDIVTRLYPIGSEGLTINGVNPTGSSYIEDFSYFLYPFQRDSVTKETIKSSFYMEDDLAHALLDHQELVLSKGDELSAKSAEKATKQTELTALETTLGEYQATLDIMYDLTDTMKVNREFTSKSTRNAFTEKLDVRLGTHFVQMRTTSGTASIVFDGVTYNLTDTWSSVRKTYTVDTKVELKMTTAGLNGNRVQFVMARIPEVEVAWTDLQLQTRYNYFIVKKQGEDQVVLVDSKKAEIVVVDAELQAIYSEISIENNFTPELIVDRNRYVFEQYWIEDNHIDAQELYDDAVEQFKTINKPSTVMNLDIINFLTLTDEVRNWTKLIIGSKLRVKYSKLNIESESILTNINYDFESNSISLSISDTKDLMTDEERLVKMIYATSSSSNYLALKKFIYDDSAQKVNAVKELLDETWDATVRRIVAGTNESVEIGKRGIIIRNPAYPDDMLVANSSVIAISNDGGLSFKNALTTQGLVAERVVGQIIIGESVWIEDDNGIITIRGDLQEIKDAEGNVKVKVGQYEIGKFGLQVLDGAVDIRTSPTANSGINFDSTSFRAYNTTGAKVFEVTTEGNITVAGYASFIDLLTEGQTLIHGNNIETGTMNWNRAKGGTLTLGGADGQNGTLVFTNEFDEPIVTFDSAEAGFDVLNVGTLNAANKVEYANFTDNPLILHVADVAGNGVSGTPDDDNSGTSWASPLKTIKKAISLIPKHFDGTVQIKLAQDQTFDESLIELSGFSGGGTINVENNSNRSTVNGYFNIWGNTVQIEILNIDLNTTDAYAGILCKSSSVYLHSLKINGSSGNTIFGINANRGSNVEVYDTSFNNIDYAVRASYGGVVFASDCTGKASVTALQAFGGIVAGSGTAPTGTTSNSSELQGGRVTGTWTYPTPPAPPAPVARVVTKTWNSTSGHTWSEKYSQWDSSAYSGSVTQGRYSTAYGTLRGIWIHGSTPSNTVNGKTIKSIRVYIKRLSSGGSSSATTITIKPHGYTSKPAGEPSYLSPSKTTTLKWGEGKWVTLPSSFHTIFANGTAKGIGVYNGSGAYAKLSTASKIEITYV